jgi:hypothetical protein
MLDRQELEDTIYNSAYKANHQFLAHQGMSPNIQLWEVPTMILGFAFFVFAIGVQLAKLF